MWVSGGAATRLFIGAFMIRSRLPDIGFTPRSCLRSLDARNSAHPVLSLVDAVGPRLDGRKGIFDDDESGAHSLPAGTSIYPVFALAAKLNSQCDKDIEGRKIRK